MNFPSKGTFKKVNGKMAQVFHAQDSRNNKVSICTVIAPNAIS